MIEPGLTGVVGPNGCGKSNLVEALRWVMGETSARRIRGDEMDDVIFGGTAKRPPRNLAEVALTLDNSKRTAPAAFNDANELDVVRRIERGSGSDYRINGRPVRARDVQILFADHATGAASPSLVSQGKVGALIGAKPNERRQLLEEAAGISGLHSRRHEAELRLKGAETNLTRLDDVITAMETQLQGLKKQARQAARYRTLSDLIRRAEAVLWHIRWCACVAAQDTARTRFDAAEQRVQELMLAATRFTTRQTEATAGLPALRLKEAETGAALQRLRLAREALDAEEKRVDESRESQRRRLIQIRHDLEREQSLAGDAQEATDRLRDEHERLAEQQGEEELLEAEAGEQVEQGQEAVETLDQRLHTLTGDVARRDAQRGALERQARDLVARLETLERRVGEQRHHKDALAHALGEQTDVALAEAEAEAAEERLEAARVAAERADHDQATADALVARAREAMRTLESRQARLRGEQAALRALLSAGGADLFPPLIDEVHVTPGFEGALAAALGDDLTAPLDEAAAVHWRTYPPYDQSTPWPAGVEALAQRVNGPPALARALAHIGVVADAASGRRLAAQLRPGQVVVTREGDAWRWDGYTVSAGAPTAATLRLQQRNRLEDLNAELAVADEAALEAEDRLAEAQQRLADVAAGGKRARDAVRDGMSQFTQARDRHARLARDAAAASSRLHAVNEALGRLEADYRDAALERDRLSEMATALPPPDGEREQITELRATLAERRTELTERQNRLDRLTREARSRRERMTAIDSELRSWNQRRDGAGRRLEELNSRAEAAEEELVKLQERPAELAADRQALLDQIALAEKARRQAADALAAAESQATQGNRQLKETEAALGDAREERARAEAAVVSAHHDSQTLHERIAERLECTPEQVLAISGLAPDEPLPEAAATETRLERLLRDRDNLGTVNLRAEIEANELEQQVETLKTERADLIAAIARLRQGIASLNREARERLLASFEKVNGHFQELFVRLFGGGRAQLELTDAEDPLAAGLEIYASPPGKRLQSLSLLSGGEQALTALSLLFAVFLVNPAPICVLDEVDAPLDEANVGRFCSLVEDMARTCGTRFLVITHHRLTMARADRLFGVTMAEQGISQLVSVDLRAAEALRAVG